MSSKYDYTNNRGQGFIKADCKIIKRKKDNSHRACDKVAPHLTYDWRIKQSVGTEGMSV